MTVISSKRFLLLAAVVSWLCFGGALASRGKHQYAAPVDDAAGTALARTTGG